jgi:hypothetical protein
VGQEVASYGLIDPRALLTPVGSAWQPGLATCLRPPLAEVAAVWFLRESTKGSQLRLHFHHSDAKFRSPSLSMGPNMEGQIGRGMGAEAVRKA